jgi:hypothetical protein
VKRASQLGFGIAATLLATAAAISCDGPRIELPVRSVANDASTDRDADTDEMLIPCEAGTLCQHPTLKFCKEFGERAYCVECLEDSDCEANRSCVPDPREFEQECEQRRSD